MKVIDFRFRPNTPEIVNGIKNSAMFKAACKAIGFEQRKAQPLPDIVADLDRLGVGACRDHRPGLRNYLRLPCQ